MIHFLAGTRLPSNGSAHDGSRPHVAIFYENDAWLGDLFKTLDGRGIPYRPVRMDDAAMLLEGPPDYPLVFNRVSPSSYLRGHGPAIPYARAMLEVLAGDGRRVINGGPAFALETSKLAQLLLLKRLGVATPRSVLFNNRRHVLELARDFAYPALLKPNCGGSGAFVRRVESYRHLVALLEDPVREQATFAPDHLLLLQEQIQSADGTIVRTEFIDGELVYAMRVRAVNTFNLCPADSCERHSADPSAPEPPRVEFEAYLDIPSDAVAQAREIVRAAHLDVGGVEYIQSADGTRWFFDINATSIYRPDMCAATGSDALAMLADFIQREFRKEIAKRMHLAARPA